jgi:hypothetical protein
MTFAGAAQAQQHGTIEAANPNIQGDDARSAVAQRAITHRPLPRSDEEVAMKAAADRAAAEMMKSARPDLRSPAIPKAGAAPAAAAPAVVGGHSFAGQVAGNSAPSDSTGAIGPLSYIQAINTSVRLYNRTNHAPIATATLDQLAAIGPGNDSFDPQIMWDPTTNRFYYLMVSVLSESPPDIRLSFGFSRTNNPGSFTATDWCKFFYKAADPARFPDYPKLGDSTDFLIIGVNSFKVPALTYVGSDLIAISKPPAGAACPAIGSFKIGTRLDLRDTSNERVFTPVPANQIDNNSTGYVVARNGALPSTKLWFFNVARNGSTGAPVILGARGLTVPSYTLPPNAAQPTFTQLLDTLDARPTQAVQAQNPDRGLQSFYVQHTIGVPGRSIVRFYEINPAPATPVLLRSGQIGGANTFFFNASISPDRRRDGAAAQYGDSFVIQYNVSSRTNNIMPGISAASSFNGGALTFANVKTGVGPYRDFTCPDGGNVCRWGDYSSATPDPRPTSTGRGEVWITNQYSGRVDPPIHGNSFRTWISAIQP